MAAALVIALLTRISPTSRWREVAAILIIAFTGGELVLRHAASALNAEPAERYAVFRQLPPEQLQGLQILKRELADRHAQGEYPRVEILGLRGPWQNASMALGLENTLGYNPLRIEDYERAVGPGENAVDPNLRHYPGTFRGYGCTLASLLGLEYLVLDRPLNRMPRHVPRPRASPPSQIVSAVRSAMAMVLDLLLGAVRAPARRWTWWLRPTGPTRRSWGAGGGTSSPPAPDRR